MLVPKLRFKEFEENWKELNLKDVSDRVTRKNINNETNLPLTISSLDGLVDQRIYFNKSIASKDMSSYYLLKKGEFAYNKSYSAGFNYGSIKRLDNYDKGALSTLYICFKLKKIINSDFIYKYFDSQKWNREVYKICTEGARNHGLLNISPEDFFDIKLKLPDIREQEKIALFLNLLDKKIELQQRKIEVLKMYKKGLLLNECSNKDKNISLEKILKIGKAGGTPKSTNRDYYNGDIPFLSISDMTNQGKYITKTEKKISKSGLENSSAWILPENTLILSMYASYGVVALNKIKLATSQAMFNMILKDNINIEYIYYYLNYLRETHYYDSIVSQGTQPNLNADKVRRMLIYLPSLEEQCKVSKIFINIDKKIDIENKKMEEILKLKNGLLQNMFI